MTTPLSVDELREACDLVAQLGLHPTAEVYLDRDRRGTLTLTEGPRGVVIPVMLKAARDSRVRERERDSA